MSVLIGQASPRSARFTRRVVAGGGTVVAAPWQTRCSGFSSTR